MRTCSAFCQGNSGWNQVGQVLKRGSQFGIKVAKVVAGTHAGDFSYHPSGQSTKPPLDPNPCGAFFFFFNIYLFIWLHRVLVVARGIFIAACRVFLVAARMIFSCGMRDLVP